MCCENELSSFFQTKCFFNSPPIASRSGDCDRPLGRGNGAGKILSIFLTGFIAVSNSGHRVIDPVCMSRLCQSTKSTDSEFSGLLHSKYIEVRLTH